MITGNDFAPTNFSIPGFPIQSLLIRNDSNHATSPITVTGNDFTNFNRGIIVDEGHASISNNTITNTTGTGLAGIEIRAGGSATVSNQTINNIGTGIDVNGGTLRLDSSNLNGNTIGVLVRNSGVADLGQIGGSDFTGLGISAGGNTFSSYTTSSSSTGAIVNLNASAPIGPTVAPPDVTAFNNTFFSLNALHIENAIYHDADDNAVAFVNFAALSNFTISVVPSTTGENGMVQLLGTFSNDPQPHTLTIDWGDGSLPQTVNVPQGTFDLALLNIFHTYLDDNPTGTTSDTYTVSVTIDEDNGPGVATDSDTVTVGNVAPVLVLNPVTTDQ